MLIAAAVAALSVAVISRTPNSQLPTPNAQQRTGGTQGDQSSQAGPAPSIPVERVREALLRPPALTIPPLPEPSATFRSVVEDTLPFESVLEGMRRDLALWNGANSVIHPPDGGLPSSRIGGGVDVLPLISSAIRQWRAARARDRVGKELAAFCAVNDCSVLEGEPSPREGILRPPDPGP
jgi:hypothetical protein